jgi:hypothetical protein
MPFEDRLGEAVRHTGDSFAPDDQHRLVEAGVAHGRRRLARRRSAVAASGVLTLAVVGLGGAYAGGLVGDGGGRGAGPHHPTVAAPAPPSPRVGGDGSGEVSGQQMIELLTSLLPQGETTREQGRGSGGDARTMAPFASVVFDDGKGAGLVGVGVSRVNPEAHQSTDKVTCPGRAFTNYEACTTQTLSDGSRYMLLKGYEFHTPGKGPKLWKAVRLTPDGVLVEVNEWNAPAEKGKKTTRKNPPLSPARMKSVATSKKWLPVGKAQPMPVQPPADESDTRAASGEAIRKQLVALLPEGRHFEITEKGGSKSEFAYVVVDDGKGPSLIQINVQHHMSDVVPSGQTSTLPDGTRVGLEKAPGEKGGAGVVMWTADTVHPDGFRVVVSAFNTGAQHNPATRTDPALTLEELKQIALDDSWRTLQ